MSAKFLYGIEGYPNELNRLYGVPNNRLGARAYFAGDFSIADMACYPWAKSYKRQGQRLSDFPHTAKWLRRMKDPAAVKRVYQIGKEE